MKYLELSIKNVEEETKKLAKIVCENKEKIDVVIFIARGSYQIGDVLSKELNCPLLEVFAKRKGNKLKNIFKPFLKIIPSKMKEELRKIEFNSNFHEKKQDRIVSYDEKKWKKYIGKQNILIVDDSVDTGNSMLQVKNVVQNYFKDSNIKIAALNCFKKSKKIIKTDYFIYEDTMLNGPWSNDSKYNKEFIKMYNNYKKENNNER